MPLSEPPSFEKGLQLVKKDILSSAYCINGFKTFDGFYLGRSKPSKKCTLAYLGSFAVHCHLATPVHERMSLCRMQTSVLRASSSIPSAMKPDLSLPRLRTDTSLREYSWHLKGFHLNGGVRVILEGEGYCVVNMVLLSMCGFIDHVTEYIKSPKITRLHTMFSLLISAVALRNWKRGWESEE